MYIRIGEKGIEGCPFGVQRRGIIWVSEGQGVREAMHWGALCMKSAKFSNINWEYLAQPWSRMQNINMFFQFGLIIKTVFYRFECTHQMLGFDQIHVKI